MHNRDVLNLEFFQSDMDRLIQIAMDDPVRYFKNFLKENEKYNPAKVPILDEFIYCCIWAFLFTSPTGKIKHSDYYILYNEYIDEEIDSLCFPENIEEKKSLERYPMIRKLLYKNEESIITNQCHTVNDYIEFLQKYGDVCRELTLYAKYRISNIDDTKTIGLNDLLEIINNYHYSDLFDIDRLKSRCQTINGIIVCFSNSMSHNIREIITQIIENSRQVNIEDDGGVYYIAEPIKKRDKIVLQGYDCQLLQGIIADFDEPALFRISEVTELLKLLQRVTGIDWIIPDEHVLRKYYQSNSINYMWYKGRSTSLNIEEYYYLLPTIKTSNNG